MLLTRLVLLLGVQAVVAAVLPSCEPDTEAHCIGEGSDLSQEGISKCLQGLGSKQTEGCVLYLGLLEACSAEIGSGGVCYGAHKEGETATCIMERTPRDQLSDACVGALPEEEEAVGLHAKFWADGKREIDDDEIEELNADDLDTYQRWMKKKKGRKTDRQKERDYAVRTAKKERVTSLIMEAATAAAVKGIADGNAISATNAAVKAAMDTAVAEDMTGTLKPFTKGAMKKIVSDAIAAAKKTKGEL